MGPIAMDGLLEEIALMPVPDKGKDFKLNVLVYSAPYFLSEVI